MKILVASDSHGSKNAFLNLLFDNKDADALFFLGDGEGDFEYVRCFSAKMNLYAVKGNCDIFSHLNDKNTVEIGGKRIFYTHGHLYGVKNGYNEIFAKAKTEKADIVLFGHTHKSMSERYGDILLFNPGSLRDGRYGEIKIENGKIETKIRRE